MAFQSNMPLGSLIYRNLWVAVGWALVLAVVYLSLVPSAPSLPGGLGDKGGHVLAYASLMFWFACLYAGRARLIFAIGLSVMGLVMELLQGLGNHRSAEPMDMVANILGIIIGWTLVRTRAGGILVRFDAWLGRLWP